MQDRSSMKSPLPLADKFICPNSPDRSASCQFVQFVVLQPRPRLCGFIVNPHSAFRIPHLNSVFPDGLFRDSTMILRCSGAETYSETVEIINTLLTSPHDSPNVIEFSAPLTGQNARIVHYENKFKSEVGPWGFYINRDDWSV